MTLMGGPGEIFKIGGSEITFQHSGNTFGEIFYILKTTFY